MSDRLGEAVGRRFFLLMDGVVAACDAFALIGGLMVALPAFLLQDEILPFALVVFYFLVPRLGIWLVGGPPLPWDKEGWKRYNE